MCGHLALIITEALWVIEAPVRISHLLYKARAPGCFPAN